MHDDNHILVHCLVFTYTYPFYFTHSVAGNCCAADDVHGGDDGGDDGDGYGG